MTLTQRERGQYPPPRWLLACPWLGAPWRLSFALRYQWPVINNALILNVPNTTIVKFANIVDPAEVVHNESSHLDPQFCH